MSHEASDLQAFRVTQNEDTNSTVAVEVYFNFDGESRKLWSQSVRLCESELPEK